MCGLVGFLGGNPNRGDDHVLIQKMVASLAHRGPDGYGIWCDEAQRVGLGHRRLAVVDLSPAGHQPMTSPSGRFEIVFNGEIFKKRKNY